MRKIVVVGLGNVGFTYVNVCVSRGIQAEWIFVDKNEALAEAQAHDFEDMVSIMPRNNSTFRKGTLADAKGADIVMIAASIPAKVLSDRLALAAENSKLMKSFAEQLKASGFKGTVIIPANPCDVMAAAFTYAGGYPAKKVISAGTVLDSARFRKFIAKRANVSPDSVQGYILGEHGASAMAVWSQVKIGDAKVGQLIEKGILKKSELPQILKDTIAEGFYIYSRKGNTCFGIGTSCYEITSAVLENKRIVMTIGVKLPAGYKNAGIYTSIPVIVGEDGYEYLPTKPEMSAEEWEQFEASTSALAKVHEDVLHSIGIDKKFH